MPDESSSVDGRHSSGSCIDQDRIWLHITKLTVGYLVCFGCVSAAVKSTCQALLVAHALVRHPLATCSVDNGYDQCILVHKTAA